MNLSINHIRNESISKHTHLPSLQVKKGSVKSSHRTLSIFEFFSKIQRSTTIAEISHFLGIPQSSTSALVKTLLDAGYLEYTIDRTSIKPSIRISLLGSWIPHSDDLVRRLPTILETLKNETGETVLLAQRNKIYTDYIYGFESSRSQRKHFVPGVRTPLACCAAGWAILQLDTPDNLRKIINTTRSKVTNSHWLNTLKTAEEKILETKKKSFALSENHTSESVSGIAIMIPTETTRGQYSIVIGGPSKRIQKNKDKYIEALQKVRAQLSH